MTQPNQFSSNEAIDKAKDYAFAARSASRAHTQRAEHSG